MPTFVRSRRFHSKIPVLFHRIVWLSPLSIFGSSMARQGNYKGKSHVDMAHSRASILLYVLVCRVHQEYHQAVPE